MEKSLGMRSSQGTSRGEPGYTESQAEGSAPPSCRRGAWEHCVGSNARIFPVQSLDLLEQFRHAGRGILFAFVFDGHETLVAGPREYLPDAVEVNRVATVAEPVSDVRVCGVGGASLDLLVLLVIGRGDEIRDVEVDAEVGGVNLVQKLKANVRALRYAAMVLDPERDAFCSRILTRGLQRFDGPGDALGGGRALGQLAREHSQVRGAEM